jgi:hypothetical protein
MSGKLSDRFAQLKGTGVVRTDNNRKNRIEKDISGQKGKREDQVNQRRSIISPVLSSKGKQQGPGKNNNKGVKAGGVKVKGGDARGKSKKGGNGKANGKNNKPKREKKKPATAEDLDMDIDEYFHAGGKGPDPKQSRLDSELDAYMSSRAGDAAPETA